jgi:hypothetical protein
LSASWQPPTPADFRGGTIDLERDGQRLNAQAQRVQSVMRDRQWHTLAEISAATGDPEASVSARLRDLRRWGFTIDRQYLRRGLHQYRITP